MRAITSSKAKLNTESQSKKSPNWSKVMISLSVKRETKPMSACRESVGAAGEHAQKCEPAFQRHVTVGETVTTSRTR
jgi:hypothetical protein